MTFRQRAIGAAKLDIAAFEEIEADRHATGRRCCGRAVERAAGIGLSSSVYDAPVLTRVMLALLLWVFWAALTYAIGSTCCRSRRRDQRRRAAENHRLRRSGTLRIFGSFLASADFMASRRCGCSWP